MPGSHRNLRASPFEEVRDPLKLTREDGCSTHTTFNEEVFGLPIPTRLRVRATYDICSICLTLLPNSDGAEPQRVDDRERGGVVLEAEHVRLAEVVPVDLVRHRRRGSTG